MLSFIILFLLLCSFFVGRRRGFILQVIHLVGFIVSLIVAYKYYGELASFIRLWIPYPQISSDSPVGMILNVLDGESVYYSGIAFALLFIGTRIILQIFGAMLDFVAHLPILRSVNRLLGGILCFLEAYLIILILIYVAALLPVELVQELLQKSIVAQLMINHTPILSEWLQEIWAKNEI
ncbi:CvpA family protein [Halalkalibacter urbisdiaboli]|uniref:CvpA family protein n=1 Tax=Halalkalibacter urbisdiaboli TaxID=1960589 RepID=UPI000B440242|nr:CvpA family protein [Halalkalibacter urbisdiaboli]